MQASPLVSTCKVSVQVPLAADEPELTYRSWQLNLTSDTPSFPIPPELPATLVAVVWSGSVSVSDGVAADCDQGSGERWIGELRPGASIDLDSNSERAEIALLGVFGRALPAFEPFAGLRPNGSLPCDELKTTTPKALIRLLDLALAPADPEPWAQSSWVLRRANGPTPRTWKDQPIAGQQPSMGNEESETSTDLAVRGIAKRLFLGFDNDQEDTEVIVCDYQLDDDVDGVGCIWRCRG